MNPEIEKRKFRQRMQSCTDQQFWDAMNVVHNQAYLKGMDQILETMWLHPKISKAMVEWVKNKAGEKREEWDGLHYVEVEESVIKLVTGRDVICPVCQKRQVGEKDRVIGE